MGKVLYLKY